MDNTICPCSQVTFGAGSPNKTHSRVTFCDGASGTIFVELARMRLGHDNCSGFRWFYFTPLMISGYAQEGIFWSYSPIPLLLASHIRSHPSLQLQFRGLRSIMNTLKSVGMWCWKTSPIVCIWLLSKLIFASSIKLEKASISTFSILQFSNFTYSMIGRSANRFAGMCLMGFSSISEYASYSDGEMMHWGQQAVSYPLNPEFEESVDHAMHPGVLCSSFSSQCAIRGEQYIGKIGVLIILLVHHV